MIAVAIGGSAMRGRSIGVLAVLAATTVLAGVACSSSGGDGVGGDAAGGDASGDLRLTAVSTRPEYVTGGDVLVEVAAGTTENPTTTSAEAPTVRVAGATESVALTPTVDGTWRGLVTGLPDGPATLEAQLGSSTATLEVTNHPVTGPLFSGPHQEPFACTTTELGLGEPLDEDCSVEPRVVWHYQAADGSLRELPADRSIPADVATATVGDRTVPVVVRTEVRTIDRGVAWVSVLDPSPATEAWDGVSDGWNGDLVYRFGGGCGTSYSQGAPLLSSDRGAPPTLDVTLLTRGYAVATNTLNTFQVHCNDVLSAEAALMTVEHVAEQYGVPRHTIGDGVSGGAIQQLLISQNYPGILDGLVVGAPFPDAMSLAPGVTDCGLLDAFYRTPEGAGLNATQRTAINGHATAATCDGWVGSFLEAVDPTVGCELPPEQIYDPVLRPDGARCTLQDSAVNLFGVDPATGFARRPLDNVGVVYGLDAFRDGVIDGEQLVVLNERIGSYDIDGRIGPERSRGAVEELELLARTGRVLQGAGDSTRIPTVIMNVFSDPTGDIHDRWRMFEIRDRLDRSAGGTANNLALWTAGGGNLVDSALGGYTELRDQALDAVAAWLEALDAEGSAAGDEDRAAKLASTRPPAAADRCLLPGGGEATGPGIYQDGTPCAAAYPLAGDPRRAAGQPLDGLTARCELQPVESLDVADRLDAAQLDRLRAVFPEGVCDWSRPGVGTVPVEGTWLNYG